MITRKSGVPASEAEHLVASAAGNRRGGDRAVRRPPHLIQIDEEPLEILKPPLALGEALPEFGVPLPRPDPCKPLAEDVSEGDRLGGVYRPPEPVGVGPRQGRVEVDAGGDIPL